MNGDKNNRENDYEKDIKGRGARSRRRMPALDGLEQGYHIVYVDDNFTIRMVSPTISVLENFDKALPGFLGDLIRGNRGEER